MVKIVVGIIVAVLAVWYWVTRARNGPIGLQSDDKDMEVAIASAQQTIDEFLVSLKTPLPNQTGFSVKKQFALPENSAEHLWLSNISYDGQLIQGEVANEPKYVKSVNIGDKVSVSPKEITDWKFIDDGKLVGGYSIRVFYQRMSESQKQEFTESVGFIVE